jgi:hypothetical protein
MNKLVYFYGSIYKASCDPGLFNFLGLPESKNREDLVAFYEDSLEVGVKERV